MRSSKRSSSRWLLALAALGGAACASPKPPPVPDLAQGLHAQEEFQPLRGKWEHTSPEGRLALDAPLVRYVRIHGQDPTSRTAQAMLGLIALGKGELDRASALATKLSTGPDGETRDMAIVTVGAIARRRGQSKRALALLAPLFGKVIDAYARGVLNEELALSAVDAGDPNAAKYVRGWMLQATEDERDEVERRVSALLARLPTTSLVSLLESAHGTDEMKTRLIFITAKRLAAIAIETRDVTLARLLISRAGPILGDQADAVARVAARGAAIRLEPNTVGLLLSERSSELSRRSLEVADGLALALGIPGSRARLVSRGDQGDPSKIDEALALLNADGAAVIIAGIDPREANAAFDYAERTGVPIVLLRPPDRVVDPKGHVFVVGDTALASREALVRAALGGGKDRLALLVGERTESDAPPSDTNGGVVAVQPCGAPLDFAVHAGANLVVVDGDPRCAREATEGSQLPVALGLDAPADLLARFRAKAGRYPIEKIASEPDADLRASFARDSDPPTWWAGLGHDAGKLTWAAVSQLPAEIPGEAQAMAERKAHVTELLGAADVPLWTTDAHGFAGGRILAREITVEERATKTDRRSARPAERKAPKR